MTRSLRHALVLVLLAVPALALGACGTEDISLAKSDPNYRGAQIFQERCAGCHTLSVAGTQGSATNVRTRENKDGPNFNQRKETKDGILYAIGQGGVLLDKIALAGPRGAAYTPLAIDANGRVYAQTGRHLFAVGGSRLRKRAVR